MRNVIEINELKKTYSNGFCALKGISLSVKEGEILGLIGKNGAGKSTTIRILLNLINQTSGEVKINGFDPRKDIKLINSFTSFVPSEVSYYGGLRVKDIINYSMRISNVKDYEKANRLYEYLEINPERKIDELSLGNRKKVSIIQALIKSPTVSILDEPTSGLDTLIQEKLFHLLMKEKKNGTSILLSSHNLQEVEKYCDRVAIIKDGNLIEVAEIDKFKSDVLNVTYTKDGKEYKMIWGNSIHDLLKELTKINPDTLEIKKPSIEEEFMKHYEED